MQRKINLEEWLNFLRIPYQLASDGKEFNLACFDCGKENHLYVNIKEQTYYCHRCGVTGGPQHLKNTILEWVTRTSEETENGTSYWSARAFSTDTINSRRLGYYAPLNRYTIPYLAREGVVYNISFRNATDEKPKYVRLPGIPSDTYEIFGSQTDTPTVVITEGEVDAISIWQSDRSLHVLGIPGWSFINDKVVARIPRGAHVTAIFDNDAYGIRAATKLRERIPSADILRLSSEGSDGKDVNEILVRGGEDAVLRVLQSSPTREDTDISVQERLQLQPLGIPSNIYLTLPDEQGDWLVEDLWMDQALGFIAGIPKAMKTMLALHLGYHVSKGLPFVTKRIIKPGPVLLFQEEDNDHIIRSRLRNIGDGSGSENLWIFTPGVTKRHVRLDSDEAFEILDDAAATIQPNLIILDPFANMHSLEDENQAGPINRMLERLRYLRDLRKCAILVVHHMNKENPGGDSRKPGQRMRGSSVFHAKAETALYISRKDNLLEIEVENKLRPGRTLEVKYTGKEFVLIDESGPGVEDDESVPF